MDLEKVKTWLDLCPFLQMDLMQVDTTQDWPVSAGLYPQGMKLVKEAEDVAGGRKCRIRQTYLLRCAMLEGEEAAKRLQQIQNWIFTQNLSGITPGLGAKEIVRGEDGRLERASQVGMSLYALTLTVEFDVDKEGA